MIAPGMCADGSGAWYPLFGPNRELIPICPSNPLYEEVRSMHGLGLTVTDIPDSTPVEIGPWPGSDEHKAQTTPQTAYLSPVDVVEEGRARGHRKSRLTIEDAAAEGEDEEEPEEKKRSRALLFGGIAIAVVIVGGGIYMVTRKRKR